MNFQDEKPWWFFRKRKNKLLMNVLKSPSLFLFAAFVLSAPSLLTQSLKAVVTHLNGQI